jgi:hypothetical protein
MFRHFLFLLVAVLALASMVGLPGQAHAQRGRGGYYGGFYRGDYPRFYGGYYPGSFGRYYPGFYGSFGFRDFDGGFDRRRLNYSFGY